MSTLCYGEPNSIKQLTLKFDQISNSGRYNPGYPGNPGYPVSTNYNQYQGINQNRNSVKFDDIYIPYYHQNA